MRTYIVLGLLLGILMGPLVYADTTDVKIKEDSARLKKDYQAKIDKDLKHIQRKIEKIKANADTQMNADLKRQAASIEARKADVDKKLVELENSTGDAWQDLRKGMDASLKDLKRSVDAAAKAYSAQTPVVK